MLNFFLSLFVTHDTVGIRDQFAKSTFHRDDQYIKGEFITSGDI